MFVRIGTALALLLLTGLAAGSAAAPTEAARPVRVAFLNDPLGGMERRRQGRDVVAADILSSAVKRYDISVFELIRSLVRGRLQPGRDYPQTIENGAFSLGTFSPLVPKSLRERVRAVAVDVAAGRVRGIPEFPTP